MTLKDEISEINTNIKSLKKMREILRKLGYNKYFEHIQYINSIFGIRPPIMSEELHETLCVLFIWLYIALQIVQISLIIHIHFINYVFY